MAKYVKNPDQITMSAPRGVLKWPKLDKVDYGSAKFPDPAGSFNTRAVYDRTEPRVGTYLSRFDAAMVRAKELAEAAFAELPLKTRKQIEAKSGGIVADQPYSIIYDEDTEEDTGKVEIKFKMKAGGVRKDKTKWTAKPNLFDGKGNPLARGIEIWGGSVAIINHDIMPYFIPGSGAYGVSRRLNAVQIITLVSAGGQRAASSYGFEAEEDGFDGGDFVAAEDDDDDNTDGPSNAGGNADDGDEIDF